MLLTDIAFGYKVILSELIDIRKDLLSIFFNCLNFTQLIQEIISIKITYFFPVPQFNLTNNTLIKYDTNTYSPQWLLKLILDTQNSKLLRLINWLIYFYKFLCLLHYHYSLHHIGNFKYIFLIILYLLSNTWVLVIYCAFYFMIGEHLLQCFYELLTIS